MEAIFSPAVPSPYKLSWVMSVLLNCLLTAEIISAESWELSITLEPRSLPNCLVPKLTAGTPKKEHSLIATLEFPIIHELDIVNFRKS